MPATQDIQQFTRTLRSRVISGSSFREIKELENSLLLDQIESEFFFTEFGIKYYSAYHEDSYKLLPIVIVSDSAPVAALAMTIKENALGYFHFPAQVFYNADLSTENKLYVARELVKCIELVKEQYEIREMKLCFDSFLTARYFASLAEIKNQHFGIIDLSLSEEEIKRGIRKSYKSLVNWGIKNMRIETYSQETITAEIIEQFKQFHIRVAGRKTRSDASWDMQFEAIKNGMGYLTLGFMQEELVAGTFVQSGKQEAFYAVGVYNRELMADGKPVAHYPVLHSVFHAKKIGLKYFNIDELDFSDAKTGKQNNIAFFKQGFVSEFRQVPSYTYNFSKNLTTEEN
jgi:hypothetical protein